MRLLEMLMLTHSRACYTLDIRVVIFNRGKVPDWVHPLFTLRV